MSDPTAVAEQLAIINVKLDLLITQRDDHEARIRALESSAEKPEERKQRDERLGALERFKWALMGAMVVSPGAWFAALSRLG